MSKLLSPAKIKDLEFRNRVVMAPMCMYSAGTDGLAVDWHFVHYLTRAVGGVGLIIQEATAVEGRGRISDKDLGLWNDTQIEGLKKLVQGCHAHGAKIGIQLAHAGRKCTVDSEAIIAPSALAFDDTYKTPNEMSAEDIQTVIRAFKEGAARAEKAGYDLIEIHAAHGYLINQFLSPLTNKRADAYGRSIENRTRFLKEILSEVKKVWPAQKPLIIRVSAEEYQEEGNHPEDLAQIINLLKTEGVDGINVSSGGVVPARMALYPGYQINYAEAIRRATTLPVIGGGLISSAEAAEEMLQNNRIDFLFLGRELLRNPYWTLQATAQLDYDIEWPVQYERSKNFRKKI